jgi:hypothetical protein
MLALGSTKGGVFMSALTTPKTTSQWPADVLGFATQHQVADYLGPLWQALRQLFPTAEALRVFLEDDPEIRDDRHIVFDVRVPRDDVPDFVAAKRRWHDELFRVCPAPLACIFRLGLVLVP